MKRRILVKCLICPKEYVKYAYEKERGLPNIEYKDLKRVRARSKNVYTCSKSCSRSYISAIQHYTMKNRMNCEPKR